MKDFKKKYLLIVLLFGILIGNTEIAYGQSSIHDRDSCICYTDNQDKRALECLINSPKKDSLISNLSLQLFNFRKIDENLRTLIVDKDIQIVEKDKNINKISLNLVRSRKMTKASLLGGLGIGLVCGILLSK